jgi:ParB-like nuclease domain
VATAKQEQPDSRPIEVSLLDFDQKNPRFPKEVAEGSVELLLERFVRDERLLEIIDSIGDQGYFPGEPLLVVPTKGGRYTVVEGNRRLAALKLLTGELEAPEGRISVEKAVDEAKVRPESVPCLVFKRENQILRYLGFRHITGIKSWSALQKARYVQRLRNENYANHPIEEGLRLLARETGSKASYMGQVLTALALYEQAERENFFGLEVSADDIDFSILSTALSYANIAEYLGLEGRTDLDLESLNKRHLKNLFLWLFVAKNNQKSIVGESRNLKKLAAIVASPNAVKELLKEGRLDEAFEYSKGPAIALTEALLHVERRLNAAWQWIPKVAELNRDHQDRAENIARTATAIRSAIESRGASGLSAPPPTPRKTASGKRGRANA